MADAMLRAAVTLSAWLLASALIALAADPAPEPLKVPPRPLEDFKFLPGTIIVVRSDSKDAVGKVDAVVLTPEEYKRLLDQIDQLKKKTSPDKPEPPSKCRISGRVETRGREEVMKIQVTFEFVSTPARSRFLLGFRKAAAVGATLDGSKLAPLDWSATDGFGVTVDNAGAHKLVLDLELALQYRGGKNGERGFTLHLPGSPITLIDQIEVPGGVESVRLRPILAGGSPLSSIARGWPAQELRKPAAELPALALGAIEGLDVYWDGPIASKPAESLTTADGDIHVQVSETSVQTTATISIKSLRGPVSELKLTTPPGAEVSIAGPSSESSFTAAPANQEKSQWLIRGRDSGTGSLEIEVNVRAARNNTPLPVGPFAIQGLLRQQGVIRVLAANNLRVRITRPRNDVAPRDLVIDDSTPADAKGEILQAAYSYGQLAANSPESAFLFVEAGTIRGEVRTQVTHLLNLTDSGWRVVTDIKATPIRTELEFIEVDVPPDLQAGIQASPPELVERIERPDATANRFVVRLAHPRRVETAIRLESTFPLGPKPPGAMENGGRGRATVVLPRVLKTFDRDARVAIAIPEGWEMRGTVTEWDDARTGGWSHPLEEQPGKPPVLSASLSRSPGRVDLTWLPLNALVAVRSTIDITLESRQAAVVHRVTLPKSSSARQLIWQASGGPPVSQARVIDGGVLSSQGAQQWRLTVPPSPDREAIVNLAYAFPMPEGKPAGGSKFEASLLWPVTTADCETRVRIWMRGFGGIRPVASHGTWLDLPPEPSPDFDSLPVLVVHGSGTQLPLLLTWEEAAGLAPASLIVERALIDVRAEGSQHHYVARYRLLPMSAPFIDIEFPAALSALNDLVVMLADKRVQQLLLTDEGGATGTNLGSRIVRVMLPPKKTALELRVEYFMSSWRPGSGLTSQWRLKFVPPRLRGSVFVGSVRWHVSLPGNDFVLPGDDRTVLDQRWGLRRFLPAPVPARNSEDLERWFRAGLDDEVSDGIPDSNPAGTEAVIPQTNLEPIQVIPIPRMPWLLLCSLVVLCAGGTLTLLRRTRLLFWVVGIAVLIGCAVAAVLWPQTAMTVLAGTPPGWLVLGLLLAFLGWQARRYHRRVVFMPGFARSKSALASLRPASAGSSARRREPSTVDVPPAG